MAYAVLRRTFEQGAYADRALQAEAARAGLGARDRALATRLAFGAVQRLATLDHLIAVFAERSAERVDAPLLAALRLGLFQILFLDAVPDHAAVHESVELAKRDAPRGAGLVNAVLRRAAREGRALLDALGDATPEAAALRHSHPRWIARLLWEALGPEDACALLAADNEPAEAAVRANELIVTAPELAAALAARGVPTHADPHLPEAVVLDAPFDAHGSDLFAAGALVPQSRASMLVSRVLDPRPGERILDLCSAPGGKATHIAALTGDRARITAVERHPGRAAALRDTLARVHAAGVTVHVGDAREPPPGPYDRALVDPPCTGLGTLQARPDLRWRVRPDALTELPRLQREILEAAAAVAPLVVYSTCTISPAENELLVDAFLADHPDWTADDLRSDFPLWKHPRVPRHLQTLPHRDGTAGFFLARLRRA